MRFSDQNTAHSAGPQGARSCTRHDSAFVRAKLARFYSSVSRTCEGWPAGIAGLWIVQRQDGLCTLQAHAAARTLSLDFSCTRYPIHPLCKLGGAHERLGQPAAQESGSGPLSWLRSRERMDSAGSERPPPPQPPGSVPDSELLRAASRLSAGSAPGWPHAGGSGPVCGTLLFRVFQGLQWMQARSRQRTRLAPRRRQRPCMHTPLIGFSGLLHKC